MVQPKGFIFYKAFAVSLAGVLKGLKTFADFVDVATWMIVCIERQDVGRMAVILAVLFHFTGEGITRNRNANR